jgi:hypothetical protein
MDYQKILEAAICAPSGDNCQPWRFDITDNRIDLYNLPEKDTSLFNFRQRASLIAHGALLENIRIAAASEGFTARVSTVPDPAHPDHIATITLEPGEQRPAPLYPYIPLRTTNRKRYQPRPLTDDERMSLLAIGKTCEKCSVRIVGEPQAKQTLARVAGLNDRLVFENPYLHEFLYGKIRWSDQDAALTGDGLDIKTLEVAGVDALGFRLFRNFKLLRFLNNFGVSRIVGKNAEKLAASASAMGIIAVPGSKSADYLMAGVLMQHLWLEATRLDLSMQLMTGITFLMQRVREQETDGLTTEQVSAIANADTAVRTTTGLADETVAIMFRIGHCSPPSARSLRLALDKIVTVD